MLSRRKMLQLLAGMPLLGGLGVSRLLETDRAFPGISESKRNLFNELGIEPLINGRGTITELSGSLMLPEVVEAIESTSDTFANLNEVQDKVGVRIAELLECEGAMVTSGAAGALTLGTAATITGMDEEKITVLPNLPGPRKEVIIQKKHRYHYDHAVRNTGVKMVEVESAEEMEEAFNDQTVMTLFFNAAAQFGGFEHSIGHEEFVSISKKHNIPSFIDAAADVPPVKNLFLYKDMGFDLVTFSGGKAIRGPQSAGLLFGRKDLIEAAKLNNNPHSDSIGRGMKVNKEEIFGMLVALESYLERDHDEQWEEWVGWTEVIAGQAETVPTVQAERHVNSGPANHFPDLQLSWDQDRVAITPEEVVKELEEGSPKIVVSSNKKGLYITVVMMKPRQVDIVGQRLKEVLEQAV
ncbi:aminotransferase class V-fold PLP-dependent enzyme [Fodinibius salsisoli]|uniref:Aminotransferase class V-fold PLP-dependent enzyme n=1 Tax=Fodinibius salsisoli TaxID=2820877 RepID=A0ABT3PPY9_9BACT|nr:aminotransferase class V-fold PLP-dependent enzyme [Fodinibius salsisoli]MCW9707927.1 aminotransferase class V-fold PLP-dependent enzyme [Fodinibius salsisoli]